MTARWNFADDHLIIAWAETGKMAGFHPEWLTKTALQKVPSYMGTLNMSGRSLFGGASWYAHEPYERALRVNANLSNVVR
jgi:hypothetical protein